MNTTLQTRIDGKLKRDAKKTLEALGLDLSSGVKLFLTQVVRTQSIPFDLFTANNLSDTEKHSLAREAKHALKHGKHYSNARDLHADILGTK